MQINNWKDIAYLESGTKSQRQAFMLLKEYKVLESLSAFNPILVSTVCVDLDIVGSDLDIICQHNDLNIFKNILNDRYGSCSGYKQWERLSNYEEVVTSFFIDDIEVEIFGLRLNTEKQSAYRHLVMMDRCLKVGGEGLRQQVKNLKVSGLKTEPAFAHILGLKGDPFLAFLELERLDDNQLKTMIKNSGNI
ncbi:MULTISPECIES: DUF4269 domain-containing protein [unclassified Marinomonas]|uniref:DUF4269 domain-containing protein n=1 Tax=unclassified Marinomonas TaxID=196814 RepID=UPI0007AF3D9C|nr:MULTISPECIES: DUF4269 domain-containing protein [unclassified Marinomonas]